jgi:23S rRNA (guanine745-N1)-methyltransferase
LARGAAKNSLTCPNGHSFDIARSGYLNLLQPQDRRSREPGDSKAAIAARRRLNDRGLALPLLDAVREIARLSREDSVLDAGSGDGFYLGTLARQIGCQGCGIDISVAAADAAARRYPQCEWIVANADRFVPYADASFSLVWSITARRNPREFRRVLRGDGRLLIAVPSPEDLIELRGAGRDRLERTVDEFAVDFVLREHRRATTAADLDAAAVEDVLVSIYRPFRAKPVEAMRVTFSLDLLLFELRSKSS